MSDIKIIKIPSQPIEQTLSQPYKTDTVGYFVNVLDGKSKASKRKFNFPSKKAAGDFYKENAGKWRIDFSDMSGNPMPQTESLLFDSQKEAYDRYALLMKSNEKIVESTNDEEDDFVINELEKSFGQFLPEYMKPKQFGLSGEDEKDEDIVQDEDVTQAEEKYLQASSVALNAAKELLNSISELYIDKGVLEKYPYFKNKLYFEENSIQMIHTQMMMSQLVLKKFFKQVIKNPTPKNIESLSKIQMSQLAISKYQREYLSDVEDSFKKLKKDYGDGQFVNQSGVEEGEVVQPDSPVINDRKKLIRELAEVTVSEELIPLSPNQRLRDKIAKEDIGKYEQKFLIRTEAIDSPLEDILEEKKDVFGSYID